MTFDLPLEQQTLNKLAMDCYDRRTYNNECPHTKYLETSLCSDCRYNVLRYVDADPRKAELFMISAETQARAFHDASKEADKVWRGMKRLVVGFILIFVGGLVIMGLVNNSYKTTTKPINNSHKTTTKPVEPKNKRVKLGVVQGVVDTTLMKVAFDCAAKVDVNKDGVINCIDAAVLFYKYYPNKNEITIELNYNKATGMNHLFNLVLLNGVWTAIEPQAYVGTKGPILMKQVWESRYDPAYNKEVTNDYLRYVR